MKRSELGKIVRESGMKATFLVKHVVNEKNELYASRQALEKYFRGSEDVPLHIEEQVLALLPRNIQPEIDKLSKLQSQLLKMYEDVEKIKKDLLSTPKSF